MESISSWSRRAWAPASAADHSESAVAVAAANEPPEASVDGDASDDAASGSGEMRESGILEMRVGDSPGPTAGYAFSRSQNFQRRAARVEAVDSVCSSREPCVAASRASAAARRIWARTCVCLTGHAAASSRSVTASALRFARRK